MEKTNLSSPEDTARLIAESFEVSGGSNEAHALYIRGIAIHLGIETNQVSQILRSRAKSLDINEFHTLMTRMAGGHKGNETARFRTSQTLRVFADEPKQITISDLIPENQMAFKKLMFAVENQYTQGQVDRALKSVWETPDRNSVNQDMRALSAELGAYSGLTWWDNMNENTKSQLKERGRKLLEVNRYG